MTLIVLAITFVTYHWKTSSKTAQFNGSRVTSQMLDGARANARTNQKFLMVEFGANWCSDCLELSTHLEDSITRDYIKKHFVVLDVDVGDFNRNLDTARLLGVDINQGIPTAVFFPPGSAEPSIKVGTNQILAYLNDAVERP